MLDVHPPHHAAHGWRDFFIHIATIVVGLLIAIGLEQTVEYFHHRHEVRETREALRKEREINIVRFQLNTLHVRASAAALENDLIVLEALQRHPGMKAQDLPGVIVWGVSYESVADSAWRTAQQTSVTALMSREEVERNAEIYSDLNRGEMETQQFWKAATAVLAYSSGHPDLSRLTPAQIDREIELTTAELEGDYRWGIALENLGEHDAEFAPAPTSEELQQMLQRPLTPVQEADLARPRAESKQRIGAAFEAVETFRKQHAASL